MASSSSSIRPPEPSTISVPSHMSSFQHPSLKFLCLGKYLSGIAGEKEKVICIVKPKIIVASVRGNLTQEMVLSAVASIHYQDASGSDSTTVSPVPTTSPTEASSQGAPSATQSSKRPAVDVVLTDIDGATMSFTIHSKHLNSLLGVALYYCPPDTPVHHISGSTVPLFESLANVKKPLSKGVIASVVGFLQHAGQDNSGQASLEFLRANDKDENDLDADEQLHNHHGGGITQSETRESMLAAAALRRQTTKSAPSSSLVGLSQGLDQTPLDDNLSEMLRDYTEQTEPTDRSGSTMLTGTARSPSRHVVKPRASSLTPHQRDAERRMLVSQGLPAGLEKLAQHRGETLDLTPGRRSRALPGDDELYQWKALQTTTPSSPPSTTSLRFAQGGSSLAITRRPQPQRSIDEEINRELSSKQETGAMMTVMKELRNMQGEIGRLKAESQNRLRDDWINPTSPARNAPAKRGPSSSRGSDDESPTGSQSSPNGKQPQPLSRSFSTTSQSRQAPPTTATVGDNVRGSLLPLMTLSAQHAAMKAIEELQDIQRSLLDAAGSKYVNPTVQRMLQSMEDPLRVLFRIVAPAVTPVMTEHAQTLGPILPSATSTGEFLPVWALVDFGEVNYDRSPLTLRQYHRIVARRVDEENVSHVMIATRQQFAIDEGYIQVPFSSVLDVALGCQPRGVRAQRLLMDGTITRSDELHDDKASLSFRTRLQHIQIQFENVADCQVWVGVLQAAVIANTKKMPQGQVSLPMPTRGDPSRYDSATAMIAAEDL